MFILFNYVTFRQKNRVSKPIFSPGRGGGGRLFEGGAYYKFLSLRRGANSKRDAYLKLGANSNIYGNTHVVQFCRLI